jgi:hypothetical protein
MAINSQEIIEALWSSDVNEQCPQGLGFGVVIRTGPAHAIHIAALINSLYPSILEEAVAAVNSGIGELICTVIASCMESLI